MKIAHVAAVAVALAVACTDSVAHAWATADIGDLSVTQIGSGPNFGITFWQVTLGTGEQASESFSYSVTMHTDGLPAARTWDDGTVFACLPLHEVKCGPDPTGNELVEAYLETYRDDRVANPFISFSGTFADDLFAQSAGTQVVSGTFTLTATNIGVGPQSDGIGLFAALWVDSNDATPAVPEPGGSVLAAAGLAAILAALSRRAPRRRARPRNVPT